MATTFVILRSPANPWPSSSSNRLKQQKTSSQVVGGCCCTITFTSSIACRAWRNKQSFSSSPTHKNRTFSPSASLSPSSSSSSSSSSPSTSTKLYVSGLSFRTTEESLRNAFQNFGQLVEVNLVMDRIANRPRGFAFLLYETEEQSQRAIEGMHGKFLDGRVIFVEVAKPRSELRQSPKQNPRRY